MKFKEFLEQSNHYFSESHLEAWYKLKYAGCTRKEIKSLLENEHDNSLEIENAESEIGRELLEVEKTKLIMHFNRCVLQNIVFRKTIAIGFRDSLDKFNS